MDKKELAPLAIEENALGIPQQKWLLLGEKTPKKYIKQRVGRGGKMLDYVETGYVVKKLNEVFNGMWDYDVLSEEIGKNHIWVKGRLTIKFMDGHGNIQSITKTQFGGSDIKRTKDGEVIDIADDLKAAASDALKKCASLLGVAGDVYFQEEQQTDGIQTYENGCQHSWEARQTIKGKAYKKCSVCGAFEWVIQPYV